jgi:hypothetical protein
MTTHTLAISFASSRHGRIVRVQATADVGASARNTYRAIADYEQEHPRIIPPKYLRNLRVTHGGYGAGTLIEYDVLAMGKAVRARARVSEPVPGRVLAESDLDKPLVTTFTVEPRTDAGARVTIATEFQTSPGFRGWLEGFFLKSFLKRVYPAELQQLDAYVRGG